MEAHVVTGRIAAPPEIGAEDLLAQIDQGLCPTGGLSALRPPIFVPLQGRGGVAQ